MTEKTKCVFETTISLDTTRCRRWATVVVTNRENTAAARMCDIHAFRAANLYGATCKPIELMEGE